MSTNLKKNVNKNGEEAFGFFTTSSTGKRKHEFHATSPFDAHTARLRRALSGLRFDAISLSFHKGMAKEREPKALPLETVCARANDAALSLCSCLREMVYFQTLRSHFKEKCERGRRPHQAKASLFAAFNAPDIANLLTKTILLSPPAARGDKAAREAEKYICFSRLYS